jgi:hypothetical protein
MANIATRAGLAATVMPIADAVAAHVRDAGSVPGMPSPSII